MNRRTIDEQARRLVAVVSQSLSRELGIPRPEQPLLGELYLRVRDRLAGVSDLGAASDDEAEDLALTIYLTCLAESDSVGPHILVQVKACVAAALRESIWGEPPEVEASVRPRPGENENRKRREEK